MKEEVRINFENVMIIDDSLIDLYIASRMILKNNFGKKVMQYSSAFEALKYLEENQETLSGLPEVIFVDIYMPGMSGFEFLAEYDKLPLHFKKHCKVFIISSSQDVHDLARANANKNVMAMEEKPISNDFLNRIQKKLLAVKKISGMS